MLRLPPRLQRTDTRLPYTTLFRSDQDDGFCLGVFEGGHQRIVKAIHQSRRHRIDGRKVQGDDGHAVFDGEIGTFVDHCHSELRSEEHTSELQSLMRISYAVFCLKKKKKLNNETSIVKDKKYH